MSVNGNVVEVKQTPRGSELVGPHFKDATSVVVENGQAFDPQGGQARINGVTYAWSAVVVGAGDEPSSTLTISPGLATDLPDTEPVLLWSGSQVIDDVVLLVVVGGESPASVYLTYDQRKDWSSLVGASFDPIPATFSDDLAVLEDADGYTPPLDISDASGDLPPAIVAQIPSGPTAAPTACPAPTVYSGSGTSVVLWPAPTEAFTRLRLYVAPTNTDGSINTSTPMDATTLHASDVKPPTFVQALTPGGTPLDPTKMYQFALGSFNEIGAGPNSAWVLGTVGQIFTMLIAKEAILGIVTANEITTIKLSGGTINIAQSPGGVENEGFSGTTLPAGWTKYTGSEGTVSVVTSGVPTGTTGSALKIANDTSTGTAALLYGRSGTVNGDAVVETRFKLTGDALRTTIGTPAEPVLGVGVRSATVPTNSSATRGIYLQISADLTDPKWFVQNSIIPSQPFSPALDTWYIAKLRVLAGVVSAKVYKEADPEPDWVTGTQSQSLTTGATYAWMSQAGSASYRSRAVWFDYIKTTAYPTGFQVLPDGTGDWPAALDPIRARLVILEALNAGARLTSLEAINAASRLGALEALNAGTRLTSLESGQTSLGTRATNLETRATNLEKNSTANASATSPFATTMVLGRTGNQVSIVAGSFTRSSGFSTDWTQCGTIPVGFRPSSTVTLPPSTIFGTTVGYQLRFNADGTVECRMSAANNGTMVGGGLGWPTTNAQP